MIDWRRLPDLNRKAPTECGAPLSRRGGTRKVSKRKRRRNTKMRDDLKRRGRHRGFSHGKA